MARGVEKFSYDFLLCDVIPIEVHVTVMFGQVKEVEPVYNGKRLNIEEYCFDDNNDFLSLEEYLTELAQEFYDAQIGRAHV